MKFHFYRQFGVFTGSLFGFLVERRSEQAFSLLHEHVAYKLHNAFESDIPLLGVVGLDGGTGPGNKKDRSSVSYIVRAFLRIQHLPALLCGPF